MTSEAQASPFSVLQQIGLINASHLQRALAHPRVGELDTHPSLEDHLVWLVLRDILSEEELNQGCAHVLASYTGDELARHEAMLDAVLAMLEGIRDNFNQQWLATLVSEGIISADERARALEEMSSDNVLASPGATLAWMVLSELITIERLDEIRAAEGGSARRAEILAEAETIFHKADAANVSAVIGAIFPGPRWLWIAAPVVFIGAMIWIAVKPPPIPACGDTEIVRTVDRMMFRLKLDSRANPYALGEPRMATPTVHGIREVGFAAEERIRACSATIKIGELERPYAYTVALGGEDNGIRVTGAEPAIVKARFGNLDADGKFANQAAPLGRAAVDTAFRAAVASYQPSADDVRMQQLLERMGRHGRASGGTGVSQTAPERSREIAEIEPLAPCREVKAGAVYSCRLLVERNDAMLAAMGAESTTLLDGEFTFARDGAAGEWRMADSFAGEYAKLVLVARNKAVGR